jgi:predicted HD superfamily hydrolase involved in NAD metabolism
VRAHLDQDRRYEHVVRVARCADVLAQHHGVDAAKARVAGLLHDLARLYGGPRLLEECERRAIPVGSFERSHPVVLHAPLGAALASELFGIEDRDVLSAIAKHTLGAAEMSPLDCIVYLADSLEPKRDFPERDRLWRQALLDLRAATAATIENTIQNHHRKGRTSAPQTIAALEALRSKDQEGATPSLH